MVEADNKAGEVSACLLVEVKQLQRWVLQLSQGSSHDARREIEGVLTSAGHEKTDPLA